MCVFMCIYIYNIYLYIHTPPKLEIFQGVFRPVRFSRKVHAACSSRRCFDKSWIWKMRHQRWLWGFDVGPVELFPSRSRATRWIVFLGGIFWWKLWGKRFWKKSWSPFQVNCACFYMFCGFCLVFFLKLEYVSVDGFFLNIPWEAQFQSLGDAPLKLPWKNKTKPGNSSVWYIDSWSNYSDLTQPGPPKNVAKAGKSLEFVQGNLGWWNIIIWKMYPF